MCQRELNTSLVVFVARLGVIKQAPKPSEKFFVTFDVENQSRDLALRNYSTLEVISGRESSQNDQFFFLGGKFT